MNLKFSKKEKQTIGILSLGTFLEYFDYYLYFHFASMLNKLFFAEADFRSTALLTSFAYCLSFIFRPIAAVIFGYIGDKYGRLVVLNMTFLLMGFSCLGIFFLPTYDSIGVLASFLITLFRILQSVSSMGEVVAGEIYLTEYLKGKKIFIGLALLILMCSTACQVALYGIQLSLLGYIEWRYMFLIGIVIFIIGFNARKNLIESTEYIESRDIEQNIKIPFKTYVAYFFAESLQPVILFISVVGINNLLRSDYNHSDLDIIIRNQNSTYCHMLYIIFAIAMFTKYNPFKLAVVRAVLGIFLIIISPLLLSSGDLDYVVAIQMLLSLLCIHDVSITPFKLCAMPSSKRFSRGVLFFSISRAMAAVFTSFGLVLFMPYLKEYFIIVFGLPFAIAFLISAFYLKSLDDKKEKSLLFDYR